MKADWRFLRLVISLYIIGCTAGYIVLSLYASAETLRAAIGAAVLSFINVLLGYGSIELSVNKNSITFLKIVLGGIGARLFLMAGLVLVMIRYFGFQPLSLTVSLLCFYVLNLGLEIYFLESKAKVHK